MAILIVVYWLLWIFCVFIVPIIMDASLAYFYDGQSKYVDHKTVETMSREVSKIITEQIRHNIPVETKSSKPKSGSKK